MILDLNHLRRQERRQQTKTKQTNKQTNKQTKQTKQNKQNKQNTPLPGWAEHVKLHAAATPQPSTNAVDDKIAANLEWVPDTQYLNPVLLGGDSAPRNKRVGVLIDFDLYSHAHAHKTIIHFFFFEVIFYCAHVDHTQTTPTRLGTDTNLQPQPPPRACGGSCCSAWSSL